MIETKRLILRPWEDTWEDARALYEHARDPAIGPAAGWPAHESVEESRKILHGVLCTPEIYAVLPKQTGRPAGCVGLTFGKTGRAYLKQGEAELGYWIGAAFQGRGFATEAAQCMLERAFTVLGMRAVWAGYYEGNEKSARVQAYCHMTWQYALPESENEALGGSRIEHFTRITRKEWRQSNGLWKNGKGNKKGMP